MMRIAGFVALCFAASSFAYPVIVKVDNTGRKQQINFSSAREPKNTSKNFIVAADTSKDFVVMGRSEVLIAYSAGTFMGKIRYDYKNPLDTVIDACAKKAGRSFANSLFICEIKLAKREGTYDFEINVKNTSLNPTTFLNAMERVSGPRNEFFPEGVPVNPDRSSKEFGDVRKQLARYNDLSVVKSLLSAMDYHESFHEPSEKDVASHNILFFGDQGTGKPAQYQVARDMFALCTMKNCDYAISAGDNIYQEGANVTKPGWKLEFVNKFVKPYLPIWKKFHFPFYMTLGNHDVGIDALLGADWVYFQQYRKERDQTFYKNERIDRMQAQIDFTIATQKGENQYSAEKGVAMWNLKDKYYTENINKSGISTFLVSLDTNYFPGEVGPNGESPYKAPQLDVQQKWLEKELSSKAARDAKWKIVFGHHAMYSVGRHGVNLGTGGFRANDKDDMLKLRNTLQPILCKNHVDFYLVGHDHHLEVDNIKCPDGHVVVQILSGAAAKEVAESPWTENVPFAEYLGALFDKNGKEVVGANAFTAKAASYPEFMWANGLSLQDFKEGTRAKAMLGFTFLKLGEGSAEFQMLQSTPEGPKTLACFSLDKTKLAKFACSADEDIGPGFLRDVIR